MGAKQQSDVQVTGSHSPVFIRSSTGPWSLNLHGVWENWELLFFLVWRDIKVRYTQTVLGVAWAILQPLAIALAISFLFGRFVKTATGELPYPVFAYAGMVVWQLFSQAVIDASNSLIVNERLVTKVYFPRVLLPLSSVIGCLLDFSISLVVLGGFMAWFRVGLQPSLLLIPIFALLAAAAAFGAGLWLSALNVKYRDVRYTLTFIIQFWFFVTPIAYPSSAVPARWLRLYALNPMVGIVDGFRWAIHGSGAVSLEELGLSIGTIAILLVGGLLYFGRAEDTFADFI